MKRLTITIITLLFLAIGNQAIAKDSANIRATLVYASNQGSSFDSSLKPYERQLKRWGSSFEKMGGGSTTVSTGSKGKIRLSRENQVEVTLNSIKGRKIAVEIKWTEGRKKLIHTSGSLPLLLGGPSHKNGVLILVIDGK